MGGMPAPASPVTDDPVDGVRAGGRRRGVRPWATDVRFLLGIVLIAASVAGVWAVVAGARQTTPMLVATRTIVPGEPIAEGDVGVVEVALGRAQGEYLPAGADLASSVARSVIGAGELIARDALQPASASTTTTVVVRSLGDVPGEVRPGSAVDVWAAAQKERGVYDAPRILVAGAVVGSVSRDESMLGGGTTRLELVVPRDDVADVLAAVAGEAAVSVVPAEAAR
jgi:hypothetical protein